MWEDSVSETVGDRLSMGKTRYPDRVTVTVDSGVEMFLKAWTSQFYVQLLSFDKVPRRLSQGLGLSWGVGKGLFTS